MSITISISQLVHWLLLLVWLGMKIKSNVFTDYSYY